MDPVRKALRLTLPVLALITIGAIVASVTLARSTRASNAAELTTRARLAASGARQQLLAWQEDRDSAQLRSLLRDIVREDRVAAVALCYAEGPLLAHTADFPSAVGCPLAARRSVRGAVEHAGGQFALQTTVLEGRGDRPALHLTWIPVAGTGRVATGRAETGRAETRRASSPLLLGVLQDFSQVQAREQSALRWGLGGLVVLIASVALLSAFSARLTSRGWARALRRALRGERELHAAKSPLLDDVRALAQRRSARAAVEAGENGSWTRERLRAAMAEEMADDGLIIVANREPYIHERLPDGGVAVTHPASGLVSALEPVMRACSGTWIAHGSGSADRETADRRGRLAVPPGESSYTLRRVWMTEEEEQGYYYGLANEGLWPLCHVAYARPMFRAQDWEDYRAINARFADAVVDEATVDDPIVLVQDYHFALAPRLIRERLPRATVITFWHIPFPNAERFGICPWRAEIIDGLLGSSIVGFHTPAHCHQFLDAVDTFVESRIDRVDQSVVRGGTRTLVRAYPISVEWPVRVLDTMPSVAACRREVFAELGLAPDALLGVGVDRLDYTKGLEERLEAIERLLERRADLRGRFTFVQLAAPSRTRIPRYQAVTDLVEEGVRRINERFGSPDYQPVILLRQHHEPDRVFRFYRAAHVCYVSSLHDGMNLVSKEFVAARDDEQGVLVLSQFAGAAHELSDALIVNPYDLEAASDALGRAVDMSPGEQGERMRAMRAIVEEHNVYRWAGRMLLDASQLRHRARRSLKMALEGSMAGVG